MDASIQPIPLSKSVLNVVVREDIPLYSISPSLSLSHSLACSLSGDLDSIRVLPGAVKEREPSHGQHFLHEKRSQLSGNDGETRLGEGMKIRERWVGKKA